MIEMLKIGSRDCEQKFQKTYKLSHIELQIKYN